MQLTTDDRDDRRRSNLTTITNVVWPDVEAAIRRLNGKSHTEVVLSADADGPYLSIGGGPARYFVFIWTADERNLILTDPRRDEGRERLVVGGQAVVFPSRQAVSLEDALAAAQTYFHTQSPDRRLAWIEG